MFPINRCSLQGLRTFSKLIVEDPKCQLKKKVNQYILYKKLGSGSSSKVYLSQDTNTKRLYAAKTIHLSDKRHSMEGASNLENEIQIMRLLNHKNIIKLHEVLHATQIDTAYLFIEFADCGTLENLITNNIYLSDTSLGSIFKQIAQGLCHLHSRGYVHHDVKPSNMMLFSDGFAKLADFGVGHKCSSVQNVVGSPAYQAPEMLGDDDGYEIEQDPAKEDVWSLGISLYEAAFGKLPYTGVNIFEIVHAVKTTPLKIPETKRSTELIDLLRKMLSVRQKERLSMEEVLKHPFITNSPDLAKIPVEPMTIPEYDRHSKVNCISATICGINYSFAKDLRSFTWPGYISMEFANQDDSSILPPIKE